MLQALGDMLEASGCGAPAARGEGLVIADENGSGSGKQEDIILEEK